ncbi:MAG: mechanosensitive ion channel, partial [Desulfobacterales bacterium]
MRKKNRRWPRARPKPSAVAFAVVALLFGLVILGAIPMVRAEEERIPADALVAPEQLKASIEYALISQKAELADLKIQLRQLDTHKHTIQTEIKTDDVQNAAHSQLLLASQLRVEDLENAIKNNRLVSTTLETRIETFQKQLDSTAALFQQTAERIELAGKQLADIKQSQWPKAQVRELENATAALLQVLEEKKRLVERRLQIYEALLARMKAALAAKKALGQKLTAELENRQKARLTERSTPYRRLFGEALPEELRFVASRITAVFMAATWKAQWDQLQMGGFERWALFLFLVVVILALEGRLRGFIQTIEKRCEGPGWYHRSLGLRLLRRSLTLLGLTLLFEIYSTFEFSFLNVGLGRVLYHIFLTLLLTRWGFDYLKYGFAGPPTDLRAYAAHRLKHFLRVFRITIVLLILLNWIAGSASLLIWLALSFTAAVFLALALGFWQQMKPVVAGGVRNGQAAPNPRWTGLIKSGTYLVFGGTLLINLAGYGGFAGLWFGGWIKTVVVLFWGWLILNAIREWHRDHRAASAAADTEHPLTSGHHLRWSLIQFARILWFAGLAAGMAWAWDPTGFFGSQLGYLINLTFTVGSLELSIKGVLLAVVIIFITHLAVRIGRSLLGQQVLAKQDLDSGLQNSILTISSYLGWGLGLVLALGILGVNATSLAVVFGALSIGIGFGLQNIFNNFISGLILLFERPIQVGDYVEVGGLWAEVKKINVRATVVQTFDNASVIIPNSEFISQQVTNWSFKDKRMRRNIEVGVAYGSDIDLVEKTLLEIVQGRKRVLQYPRPDVLFIDHAASALIFRLRIWVNVDDYWSVP